MEQFWFAKSGNTKKLMLPVGQLHLSLFVDFQSSSAAMLRCFLRVCAQWMMLIITDRQSGIKKEKWKNTPIKSQTGFLPVVLSNLFFFMLQSAFQNATAFGKIRWRGHPSSWELTEPHVVILFSIYILSVWQHSDNYIKFRCCLKWTSTLGKCSLIL